MVTRLLTIVLLLAAAAAGAWYFQDLQGQAEVQRDADRREAVDVTQRRLETAKAVPAQDAVVRGKTGVMARYVPKDRPPETTIAYATDGKGKYQLCTFLERGGAYYATARGSFDSKATESCSRDADPAAVLLSAEARMTSAGRDAYLGARPQLVSKGFIQRECSSAVDEGQLQGCYAGNRIYLIDLPESQIKAEVAVTAAHEMLHAVWQSLSDTERKELEPLLDQAARDDQDTKDRAGFYEGPNRLNEIHSIIGTEFARIDPQLERHYAKYLSDRATIVDRHLAYERLIEDLRKEIEALRGELDAMLAQANARRAAGDIDGYNALVGPYNQLVAETNEKIRIFNQLTAHTRPDETIESVRER